LSEEKPKESELSKVSKIVLSAPCENCGYKMEQVPVYNYKAKCPECGSENRAVHS